MKSPFAEPQASPLEVFACNRCQRLFAQCGHTHLCILHLQQRLQIYKQVAPRRHLNDRLFCALQAEVFVLHHLQDKLELRPEQRQEMANLREHFLQTLAECHEAREAICLGLQKVMHFSHSPKPVEMLHSLMCLAA